MLHAQTSRKPTWAARARGIARSLRYSLLPMQQAVKTPTAEQRLTLTGILDWLLADKMIAPEQAEQLRKERRYYRGAQHPLVSVAEQKWKKGHAPLTLEALTEWLAKRVGLEYLHIDPLKIDFSAVTDVMSSAYATRFRILPVGVSGKEAIIATAEPHVRDWEKELAPIIKRDIKRVIANPLDIERYQVEFYNLAKSIKGAGKSASGASGLSNFEQLVELGKGDKPVDANDAHVVRIVDWLWQYAFEQRASDIHVEPRREQGFSEEDYKRWQEMTNRPNGIVLVTGPTGSGKTTTLYSTLKSLATPEVNVCTIEDPIEMVEGAFNQMQVVQQIDLGFAEGVRALMRQDPDIIMVGEIRDLETAEMAVQSALTGHLVLSTLHTNDAPSAVARLLELGVPPYLLNATLNGVMAQRLVRTLCPHCKQKVDLQRGEDQDGWDALVAPWKANRPAKICKPVGCLECRMTGYLGRVGIYETLLFTGAIKSLTAKNAELAAVREQAMKEGMKPLRISGAMKVAAGVTTIDEVLKVAPPIRDASAG